MSRGELALPLKCYLLSGQKKVQITLTLDFLSVFLNVHLYCMVTKNYCFSLGDTKESRLKLVSKAESTQVKTTLENLQTGN